MTKIAEIQKDVILFAIILGFFVFFLFYWRDVYDKKEEFNTISIRMNEPVPGVSVPYWTNSKLNGINKIPWQDVAFDTNTVANSSKNSEFSFTFWLFLGDPKMNPQPIFRIVDGRNINSPGIWLIDDNIQVKNSASNQNMIKTQITRQSLDFYTIVFTANGYRIYINGLLRTKEDWDIKPEKINNPGSAYIELATAGSLNHYVVKDVNLYNEVFTSDTVSQMYDLTASNIIATTERDAAIHAIGGLPVRFASDWEYQPTVDTFYTMNQSDRIGDWSTTTIENSSTMSISFWINVSATHRNWRCIFHVSDQDTNCCNVGNRVPAMWIYPGSTNVHFRHSTLVNGNDGPYIDQYQIPMNTPTFITIVLNSTTISFYANGSQIGTTHHFPSPLIPAKSNAQFYMADPWHGFGDFQLKNFKLYNNAFNAKDVSDLYSGSGG